MSQQGDAFVRRVLKADPAPMTFQESMLYLRQRYGSGRAAARQLGVSESSLRRWNSGTTPRPATRDKVLSTVRELRSRPSRMGDAGVILPVVSQDRKRGRRERDVSGRQLQLRPGTLQAAHETWIATGNADKALEVFIGGIGESWYRAQLGKGLRESRRDSGEDVEFDEELALEDAYGMSIG